MVGRIEEEPRVLDGRLMMMMSLGWLLLNELNVAFTVKNGSNNEDEEDQCYDWELISPFVPFLHHYTEREKRFTFFVYSNPRWPWNMINLDYI